MALKVVTDWESRIYRVDYLVEVNEDNEEISDRYHIYSEFKETDDSGQIDRIDADVFRKSYPGLSNEYESAFLSLKIDKRKKS